MGTRTGAGQKRAQRASTDIMIEVKRPKRTSMEEAKEEEKESQDRRQAGPLSVSWLAKLCLVFLNSFVSHYKSAHFISSFF